MTQGHQPVSIEAKVTVKIGPVARANLANTDSVGEGTKIPPWLCWGTPTV